MLRHIVAPQHGNESLMEDAATADICRATQAMGTGAAKLSDGCTITTQIVNEALAEELDKLHKQIGEDRFKAGKLSTAAS